MNPVEDLVSTTLSNQHTQQIDEIPGPFAKCDEVRHCQFSNWYPKFSNLDGKKRKNVTILSIVIQQLPADFEKFLLSDGVKLPADANKLSSCAQGNSEWSSDEEDGENSGTEGDSDSQSREDLQFSFPQLNKQLEEAIVSLKGSVIPKLNWSTPKDAAWVNGGSLRCQTIGDIYLLLKSSDFCLHDVLRKAWKECGDYHNEKEAPRLELVLRKWCNLHPSMEFRCFVRQHELLAISQRQHTQHYPHLEHDHTRILTLLIDFFETNIQHNFADGVAANYIFDVYVDKKNRVWLLDFNIWAKSTDSLLFEWDELLTLDVEDDPYFRLVETANQVRQDPLASYRAPIDTVNLASVMGGDSKAFETFMKQCQNPTETDTSDEE